MTPVTIKNSGTRLNPPISGQVALTIGNFDGLHRGHQALTEATREQAATLNVHTAALTFEPHPSQFFDNREKLQLYTVEQRARALHESGIDVVIVQNFDHEFASQSVHQFLSGFILEQLRARAVVVGCDFRFARDRAGQTDDLITFGRDNGVVIQTIPAVIQNLEPVKSSKVREIVSCDGNVQLSNQMLGHRLLLEGRVQKGDQRGRTIGFPTLNIDSLNQLLPKDGVYCGWVALPDENEVLPVLSLPSTKLPCVVNLGVRPTFDGVRRKLEVHAIDTSLPMDNLYGRRVGLYLERRIRDEHTFENVTALINQIQADVATARRFIS